MYPLEKRIKEYSDRGLLPVKNYRLLLDKNGKSVPHSGGYGSVFKLCNTYGQLKALKVISIPKDINELIVLKKETAAEQESLEYKSFCDGNGFLAKSLHSYIAFKAEKYTDEYKNVLSIKNSSNDATNIIEMDDVQILSFDVEKPGDKLGRDILIVEKWMAGSLKSFAEGRWKRDDKISGNEILNIAMQIAMGLLACHSNNVFHRDIKPGNILYENEGGKNRFVIADFGISKKLASQGELLEVSGTDGFINPRLITGSCSLAQADIYSFGKVLQWLLNGQSGTEDAAYSEIEKIVAKCYEPEHKSKNDKTVYYDCMAYLVDDIEDTIGRLKNLEGEEEADKGAEYKTAEENFDEDFLDFSIFDTLMDSGVIRRAAAAAVVFLTVDVLLVALFSDGTLNNITAVRPAYLMLLPYIIGGIILFLTLNGRADDSYEVRLIKDRYWRIFQRLISIFFAAAVYICTFIRVGMVLKAALIYIILIQILIVLSVIISIKAGESE